MADARKADRWAQVEDLFHRTMAEPPEARQAFLDAQQRAPDVIAEVRALVQADAKPHTFLDTPNVRALPSGMRLGPYAVERVLGAGGSSTVYLARRADRQFEKHVAVKLLNLGLSAEITDDRVEIERRALAQLEHPNIARLIDAGVSAFGQPYLVMELVDGLPLERWIATAKPSLDARLDLWLQVADAIAHAHRKLIVHRDLKPSNVIVTAEGVPKLVDFGIAKLLSPDGAAERTRTRHFTLRYASPEQVRGDPVSTATDVYSLGVLLHELAAGEHPLGEAAQPAQQDVRPSPLLAPDLRAILAVALRQSPERRYATVDHFAEDVRRFRRGLPVSAQPESPWYLLSRFVGRHRIAVTAAGLVAVSLVTLTAVAWQQARVANAQRVRAEQVTRFITGFLGGAPTSPDWLLVYKGSSLRVVELADLMSERIERELGSQPEAEATLRHVLSGMYLQMGDIAKAQAHTARATALAKDLYPDQDARRLSVALVDAGVLVALGKWAEAERAALDLQRRWPDPPLSVQATIEAYVGLAQFRLGRIDEAERTMAGAVAHVSARGGELHPGTWQLRSNLALIHLERGHYDRAAAELERAIAIARATYTGHSIPVGWSLVNLANTYRFLGDVDRLAINARDGYDHLRATLGESHYSLVHPLALMAYAKAMRGEADADEIARRAIAVQEQLPSDHYERAVGLTFLGVVLMQQGRLTDARQALERALALRRAGFKAPNWRIAETAGYLGAVLARMGNRSAAEPLLDESLETFTKLYGSSNPRTLEAATRRADALAR
jgi:serine/threonine-protein kinase